MFWNPKMLPLGGALLVLSTTCCAMRGEKGGASTAIELDPAPPSLVLDVSRPAEDPYQDPYQDRSFWESGSQSSPKNNSDLQSIKEEKEESEEESSEELPAQDDTVVDVGSGEKESEEGPDWIPSCLWRGMKRLTLTEYSYPLFLGIITTVITVCVWLPPVYKMITNDGIVAGSYNASRSTCSNPDYETPADCEAAGETWDQDRFLDSWEKKGHFAQGFGAALLMFEYIWPKANSWWWAQTGVSAGLYSFYPIYNLVKRIGKMDDGYHCEKMDDGSHAPPTPGAGDCRKVFQDSSYYVNHMDFSYGCTAGVVLGLLLLALCSLCSGCTKNGANVHNERRKVCHRCFLVLIAVVLFAVGFYSAVLGWQTMGNLNTNPLAG